MIPARFWLAFSLGSAALAALFLIIYDGGTAFTCAIAGIAFLYVADIKNPVV